RRGQAGPRAQGEPCGTRAPQGPARLILVAMAALHRELKRTSVPNAMGHVVLAFAERTLRPGELVGLREQLWRTQTYLYVTPGPLLIDRALEGFPRRSGRSARAARSFAMTRAAGAGTGPTATRSGSRQASRHTRAFDRCGS